MHKLQITYDKRRLIRKPVKETLYLEMPDSWDELTQSDLLTIVGLAVNPMDESMRKTLLLAKLSRIPMSVWVDIKPIQIMSIYDCVEVFLDEPKLTKQLFGEIKVGFPGIFSFFKNPGNDGGRTKSGNDGGRKKLWNDGGLMVTRQPRVTRWLGVTLIGPGDMYGGVTVDEFIEAEDHYFDYCELARAEHTDMKAMEAKLDLLVATLWRERDDERSAKDADYNGDARVRFNQYHVKERAKRVKGLPLQMKLAMLYYYQGCRSTLQVIMQELFAETDGNKDSADREAWIKMLAQLPNEKFGTMDQIGGKNLLTVLYFTDFFIGQNKKKARE